ncbi:MAG: MBG domain-containing protein, partial [Chryseobacterium sp.]
MGFENDLNNWNLNGSVTLRTEPTSVTAGTINWMVLPNNSKMAELTPSGSPGVFQAMSDTLKLSLDSSNYITDLFPHITNVSYIYKDIELEAGEEFSMGWNYVSTDYEPFNDASFVSLVNTNNSSNVPIINGYYGEVSILGATVTGTGNYSTGSYGSTGWQIADFKAFSAGTYRLAFAVYNLDDVAMPPYLFIDEWSGTTLKNGVVFEPIAKDNSAPLPPESINYSVDTFDESSGNDGSISTTSQITLKVDAFTGNVGEEITAYETSNVPSGLDISITKTGETTAELSFTKDAVLHDSPDSVDNVVITFKDGAFAGNNASALVSATSALKINFLDPYANNITFNQPGNKSYGDNPFALNATSDSGLSLSYVSSDTNVATVDESGTVTIIGAGTTNITVSDGGNESYLAATDVMRTLTVSKKDASATPNAKTKIYGDSDPAMDGSLSGLLVEDNVTAVYSRTTGESAGNYSISVVLNPAGALDNYNITYNTAVFTIERRPITVDAVTDNKIYDGTKNSYEIPSIVSGTLAAGENAVWIQEYDTKDVGTNKTITPSGTVTDDQHTDTTSNYDITYNSVSSGVITLADPIITLNDKTSSYTGSPITIDPADVIGVSEEIPPGNVSYIYYTDRSCTTLTTPSNSGASAIGQAPVYAGTYYVKATIAETLNYTSQTTAAPGTLIITSTTGEALSIGSDLIKTYTDESFTLNPSGGSGTGTVTFTSSNPAVA